MRHATILTVLVGCASVSDPPALAAPGMYVEQDSAVRVFAPDYQMDFSSTGLFLPERLLVDHGAVDLLGKDLPCFESGVGIGVTPAVTAHAGMVGKAVHSEIQAVQSGPAVVQIHVTYRVDYDCPGPQTLSGETHFTLMPTGRIVRHDVMVVPSTNHLGLELHCGCQQETMQQNVHNLFFTSYWAFDPTLARQVNAAGNMVTEDVYDACTLYPDRAIAVRWTPQAGTGTRFHADAAASHILDWVRDATGLDPAPRDMVSAIQISNTPPKASSDCGKVLALLDDVAIDVAGAMIVTDDDGIYHDATPHPGAFTIAPRDAPVPAGSVVSVDLGGASHARLSRSPAKDPVALIQRESETRFLFALIDGLQPGETVTIEPMR